MAMDVSPKVTYPHVLKAERDEPRSRQTRWLLRPLTREQWMTYRKLGDSDSTGIQRIRELFETLAMVVAGAAGPLPLAAEQVNAQELAQRLTIGEAFELYDAGMVRCGLDEGEEKN